MKKLIFGFVILVAGLIIYSCSKEEIGNDSLSSNNNTTSSSINQRTSKVNVVHNGQTLNINENALLAHLNHGDKIGSVEDNVILQSIILDVSPLDYNDPIYEAFRKSNDFLSYNESVFGSLDLNNAKMVSSLQGNAISIPIISKNVKQIAEFVGYVLTTNNNMNFYSLVSIEKTDCMSIKEVGGVSFCDKTGEFSMYDPKGSLAVKILIDRNKIIDYTINDGTERSCFSACFSATMNNCLGHFGCAIACGLLSAGTYGIGCALGAGACCALDCGLTGQSTNCTSS